MDCGQNRTEPESARDERVDNLVEDESFEDLIRYLKEARNFDFTGYKRSSLARRVNRQMQDIGIAGYDEYRDYLELHPEEFTSLFNTILINVTSFFRDTEAWDVHA